jgi:hypothetical protein
MLLFLAIRSAKYFKITKPLNAFVVALNAQNLRLGNDGLRYSVSKLCNGFGLIDG